MRICLLSEWGMLIRASVFLCMILPGFCWAADSSLAGCDLDGDGVQDRVQVERSRFLVSDAIDGQRLALEARYRRIQCSDVDGDGRSEVVLSKGFRTTALKVSVDRALRSVCRAVRSLYRGEIWKSIASKHIADRRSQSTSFITLRSTLAPRFNCLNGYDSNGNLIHRLGRYFPTGAAYSSRFYGGHGCGDGQRASVVSARARRQTGKTGLYLTSGTGNCALIPDPSKCYNSSAC